MSREPEHERELPVGSGSIHSSGQKSGAEAVLILHSARLRIRSALPCKLPMTGLPMNTLATLALVFAASTAAPRATSPWDGTWKLDRAKSHLTGQTMTLSKAKTGKWRYSDGTISLEFALDGKPVHTIGEGTLAATADGDNALNIVTTTKGSETRQRVVLSADGKTMTDHTTGTRPDGSKSEGTGTMERVGTGSGFAGTWKSTKTESSTSESFGLSVIGDRIKWEWPAYKQSLDGKMDGSDIPVTGAAASAGTTFAIRKISATKLSYTARIGRKVLGKGTLELSADGKTLTDTSWTPAKPKEKASAVYMR